MKRASSRKKAVKVPAAAAAAAADDATSDEEQQVSAQTLALLASKQEKGVKGHQQPIIKIVTSNEGRSAAIDTITKTKIKGPHMFNLIEQYLVQKIGEETRE
jgi:hypothetical protein